MHAMRTLAAAWILLGLGAAAASAQELVPAGSINAAASGPKKVIVVLADPAVVAYAKNVRKQFFADAELIEEAGAVAGKLAERDVVFFGTPSHPWLDSLRDRLPFRYKDGVVELEGRRFEGAHLRVICAIRNPEAPARRALLYTAAKPEDVVNINAVFHGPTEWVVADGARTLAAGSFRGPPLSVEHLKADLDEYVRRVRDVHPATTDGMPADLEEAIKRAQGEITAPMTRDVGSPGTELEFAL